MRFMSNMFAPMAPVINLEVIMKLKPPIYSTEKNYNSNTPIRITYFKKVIRASREVRLSFEGFTCLFY